MSLLIALAAAVLAAAPVQGAPAQGAQGMPTRTSPVINTAVQPRLFHVWATADGESHFEQITVSPDAGPLPLSNLVALSYAPTNVTWHTVGQPQFAINLTGNLEVEVSDGSKHKIGPGDLVFIEDTHGKGHVTRLLGPVTCLFIRPMAGFDVAAWAKGPAPKAP